MTRKMACVGVGTIGRSWAIAFARAGYQVALFDAVPGQAERARDRILDTLARGSADQRRSGDVAIESLEAIGTRLRPYGALDAALYGAAYVQESISEDEGAKRALFADLDALADDNAILASSTSEIPLSRFADRLPKRSRTIVAHPINPPHLIPLVEVVRAEFTDPDVSDACMQVMYDIGQQPILVQSEIRGFVVNRLQYALVAEALRLVAGGHCMATDVDLAVKRGLGMRWSFMGPFETGHLNADGGYRDYAAKFTATIDRLLNMVSPGTPFDSEIIGKIHDALLQDVPLEDIPACQLRRDDRLASLRHAI